MMVRTIFILYTRELLYGFNQALWWSSCPGRSRRWNKGRLEHVRWSRQSQNLSRRWQRVWGNIIIVGQRGAQCRIIDGMGDITPPGCTNMRETIA